MQKNVKLDADGYPCWSLWDIIKGRTFPFLLGTAFFAFVMYDFAEIFTDSLPGLILFRIMGKFYFVFYMVVFFLLIPGGFSALLQRWLCKRKLRKLSPEDAVLVYEWESKFKWCSHFGTILGFIVFCIIEMIASYINPNAELFMTVAAVVCIFGTKLMNRLMVKITHTNEALIQDLEDGYYWDELPEELQTEREQKAILKKLKKGAAFTLESAVKQRQTERLRFSLIKWSMIIGAVLGMLLCSGYSSDEMAREISQEICPDDYEEKKKKEEAKAKEDAKRYAEGRYYAARDQARKGAACNPNSRYTRERINEAKYWRSQF